MPGVLNAAHMFMGNVWDIWYSRAVTEKAAVLFISTMSPTGPRIMSDLPHDRLYAVRHGQTGKIWTLGAMWYWPSLRALQKAWKEAKEWQLVKGNLSDHKIVEIQLIEHVDDEIREI